MGFFASAKKSGSRDQGPSVSLLHRLECKACPLQKIEGNLNPNMLPTGSKNPQIYILGEAPGREEDEQGKQFAGKSGKLLRGHLPKEVLSEVRWNNVVRTRPERNATPERTEIESCRPSITRDIVASKPAAIFGFGKVPLQWALGQSGLAKWRGRRIPVNIGGHTCWFFPFTHPIDLLRLRKQDRSYNAGEIGSESERAFVFDLERAIEFSFAPDEPHVWTPEEAESHVEIIECSAEGLIKLERAIDWAIAQPSVGFDYETWRIRPYAKDSAILTAAIGTKERSFAFAIDHPQAKWSPTQKDKVRALLKKFLLAPVRKCVHFLRFEQEWSAFFFGPEVLKGNHWESSDNQAAVLDERAGDTKPGCFALDFLCLQHFGINIKKLSPLNRKDLRREPLKDVLRYNGIDAKFHHMLFVKQRALLKAEGLQEVYEGDLRRIPALTLSQIKGVPIHQPVVRELQAKYQARVAASEKEIAALPIVQKYREKFGKDFSSSSNKQLGEMFLKVIGDRSVIQRDQITGKDKFVVDEEVLKLIDHPLAAMELKRRKAAKRLATYIEPYLEGSDTLWPDGKIHPIYNQPGTMSDRTSSEEPNVQNQNKRDPEAKETRRQYRAPKGHVWCSIDYGQIQARAIAMMSGDKKFIKYLWERHDIHEEWTNEIAYAYPSRVGGKAFLKDWSKGGPMKTFRTDIKNQWTFPSFFGAHITSRAEYLNIPVEVLKPIDDKFWREFAGVAQWQERLLKQYWKNGFVEHMNGRRNRGPLSRNQVFNLPIQGAEAEIVVGHAHSALSELALKTGDMYFQPELEIHDDLSFLLPEDRLDYYIQKIVTIMLSPPYEYINVPLSVEVSIGKDLYDMEEVLVAHSDDWFK